MTFLRFSENRWGLIMFVCAGIALMMERWAGAAAPSEGEAGVSLPAAPPRVPESIVGNILDMWGMLPGDTKQDLKDQEPSLYGAMERLQDWIEENR